MIAFDSRRDAKGATVGHVQHVRASQLLSALTLPVHAALGLIRFRCAVPPSVVFGGGFGVSIAMPLAGNTSSRILPVPRSARFGGSSIGYFPV